MTRTTLWSTVNGDVPANLAFTNNFAATADPTATDDSSKGYSAGSVWLNTTNGKVFVCGSATAGAASWTQNGQSQGLGNQATPIALTAAATLTAAQIAVGLLTSNPGGGVAVNYQLPLATAMDTAFPSAGVNSCFDFSLVSISTVVAEDATITTNTGWALVGNMTVASNAAATDQSAGRFRARKTGTGAWSLYRIA
jgi:hypothetical protein